MSQLVYLTETEVEQLTRDADTVIEFQGDRFLVDHLELGGTLVTQYQVCDRQIVHQQRFVESEQASEFVRSQIYLAEQSGSR